MKRSHPVKKSIQKNTLTVPHNNHGHPCAHTKQPKTFAPHNSHGHPCAHLLTAPNNTKHLHPIIHHGHPCAHDTSKHFAPHTVNRGHPCAQHTYAVSSGWGTSQSRRSVWYHCGKSVFSCTVVLDDTGPKRTLYVCKTRENQNVVEW